MPRQRDGGLGGEGLNTSVEDLCQDRLVVSVSSTSDSDSYQRGNRSVTALLKASGHNGPASYTMQYVNYLKHCNYWQRLTLWG